MHNLNHQLTVVCSHLFLSQNIFRIKTRD